MDKYETMLLDRVLKNPNLLTEEFVRANFTGVLKEKMWIKLYEMGKIGYRKLPKHLRLDVKTGKREIKRRK